MKGQNETKVSEIKGKIGTDRGVGGCRNRENSEEVDRDQQSEMKIWDFIFRREYLRVHVLIERPLPPLVVTLHKIRVVEARGGPRKREGMKEW